MCGIALKCDDIKCTKWRWKSTAEAHGETHCLCGRKFQKELYKPLPARTNGARGAAADRSGRAQGAQAKAKAAAKPKPKAKGKAKPAPWRNIRSPTEPKST